ncbi:DUF3426 domain-containing protein [Dechloromonas sp. HYN0024]|uniref:DUF3426 domain-containing protein n=1 Tax=Dechloromonas sp. HYN0024 TaxID=2231055 RepID=UPI000E43EB46|nr:DUF3426 domain-containing protein [Dechloromonas sp. HYN0024]AXS81174.1 DUF3426 domain-containing protein [Dechloromonas sp. HYN0024]
MPGWDKALMRTRCPACTTVFRVTSEQLRLRAGKVRCGHCQAVFNAFDELVSEDNQPLIATPQVDESAGFEAALPAEPEMADKAQEIEPPAPEADFAEALPADHDTQALVESASGELTAEMEPSDGLEAPVDEAPDTVLPVAADPAELPIDTDTVLIQAPLDEPLVESPEESTQAARQAGLVAARELSDTSSFNRWSAGTLASDGLGGFAADSTRRPVWPFVLVAALLLTGLLGQLMYYFRTDIVLRIPATAGLYELAMVDIPLPRNATLVSIETSDLQSENARGLFVLQATLKNRAAYSQAWPALELSLTDTNDSVVSRRVMFAADYLPPGTTADAFQANGELAVKLSIEAKNIGASGYRLYLFYP